jgi:predicted  nucleic acid-binding Zn-ribbon protein
MSDETNDELSDFLIVCELAKKIDKEVTISAHRLTEIGKAIQAILDAFAAKDAELAKRTAEWEYLDGEAQQAADEMTRRDKELQAHLSAIAAHAETLWSALEVARLENGNRVVNRALSQCKIALGAIQDEAKGLPHE